MSNVWQMLLICDAIMKSQFDLHILGIDKVCFTGVTEQCTNSFIW